ncbi:alpha/beta fold hydrolase [Gordonia rubripertincta]|uniref:Abhydrolase domain-containing 18 n=1 Tax=Gordonia rubripertincta TaxID=36822 RepID=A0ABT4N1A1_GORRU|nr:abhydrolase domain-containing 18 [Gordonia rubripertincta]MCZ4553050.1 abhydrolase domain-containing 18 [Gordonia rubripertincta]
MTTSDGSDDRGRWTDRFESSLTRLSLIAEVMPRAVVSARTASRRPPHRSIPPSSFGVRTVGESALDEFFIAAFSMVRAVPDEHVVRAYVNECAREAVAVKALGVGVNLAPTQLSITRKLRRNLGGMSYDRIDFTCAPVYSMRGGAQGSEADAVATARMLVHQDKGHPWLLWVHGAGQGRVDDLLSLRAAQLHELGYNVVFPVLPGHGLRRRRGGVYPSFDVLTNVELTVRAVAEVRALIQWMATVDDTPVSVGGISLGGPIAGLIAGLEPSVESVLAVVPMLDLHETMAHHLVRGGDRGRTLAKLFQSQAVRDVASAVDPLAVTPFAAPERRLVVAALNDRVTSVAAAQRLHAHWGGAVHWYPGGHISGVMAGEVRAAIVDFLHPGSAAS